MKFNSVFGLTLFVLFTASCTNNSGSNDEVSDFSKFALSVNIEPTENCNSKCVDLKKEFRYVVYVGENIYCYWNEKQAEHGVDFKKLAVKLEDQITNKTTELEYFMLLTKWAAVFKDGHVNAMLRDDTSEIEFYGPALRFEVLAPGTDHETLIVSAIGPSIENLKVGTVVEKIQGVDWRVLALEAEQLTSGSTPQMRRRSVGNYIPRILLEKEGPRTIKIEGRYKNEPVSEVVSRNISLYDGAVESDEGSSTGIDSIKSMIIGDNIGYLRIDEFGGTAMSKLLSQAMDRLSETKALLIDVRKNGGGNLVGDIVLSRLIGAETVRFHQKVRVSDMLQVLRPWVTFDYIYNSGDFSEVIARKVKPTNDGVRYSKPVMVLTSSFCFSACDTFVSAIKENKLGTVVGESTGGGTGNPQGIELPYSEHLFRYSVAQGFTAVGKQLLEGVGTSPDIIIEPTVEERISGKDLQLKKAISEISKLASTNSQKSDEVEVPESLINIKPATIKKPFELERDLEIRKSKD